MKVNKLCGKPLKCLECPEYTGYAGDDCDYIEAKYTRQFKRQQAVFTILFLVTLIGGVLGICL